MDTAPLNQKENLTWCKAFLHMLNGEKVARRSWDGGYWCIEKSGEKNTIMIHTHEGEVLDIVNTSNVLYTALNTIEDDWYVVENSAVVYDNPIKQLVENADSEFRRRRSKVAYVFKNNSYIKPRVCAEKHWADDPVMTKIVSGEGLSPLNDGVNLQWRRINQKKNTNRFTLT